MPYTLEQVRSFIAVVDSGGFSQAARRLNKHIATVRDQVVTLEAESGLQLFTRKAKSLELTEQGRTLYASAYSLLVSAEQLDATMDSLHNGESSSLSVGIDSGLLHCFNADFMGDLARKFSDKQIKLLVGDTLQIKSWLMSNLIDVGVCYSSFFYPVEIKATPLAQFEVKTVIANSESMKTQLAELGLAGMTQCAYTFTHDTSLQSKDILSSKVVLANNHDVLIQMVLAGIGFAHLAVHHCQSYIEDGRLLAVAKDENNVWSVDLLHNKDEVSQDRFGELTALLKQYLLQLTQ
ncbi:LysR family transcriptional regulator [Paraferrimonas sedimenticola]|uniref:LysR family transcriptional regulator n=1 Tax=Paraferrimonas sedimenticola TaxID=375674 RepID=A0AA37VVY1_9GAMM|nr:LysR family transcriptional regulator [Paraferrimonas sedimenticola]GLP96309.1 LysR family transcriptional regulator [Paraferrimonas sedimenticola]